MFNRVITGVQLKPWLNSKYFVQYYPVRNLYKNSLKYSMKGDKPTEELPSSVVPKDFQKELFLDTYCPPLAQPRPRVHPIKKSLDVLKITGRNDPKTYNNMFFPRHCDIVIIGGGIMGCSIAYWLKQRGHDNGLRVIVVERDPSYTRVLFNYCIFIFIESSIFLKFFSRLPLCYLLGVYVNNFPFQRTYKCLYMGRSF